MHTAVATSIILHTAELFHNTPLLTLHLPQTFLSLIMLVCAPCYTHPFVMKCTALKNIFVSLDFIILYNIILINHEDMTMLMIT